MKSAKVIGIRLVGYLNKGINWKDHKDIVLDYWVQNECQKSGYHPSQFKNKYYTDELEPEQIERYEQWFNSFDFQTDDRKWAKFVDGTLNLFYHTGNQVELDETEWFIYLTNAEVKAREIVESQIFHGNPDINNFWKLTPSGKYEEVAGRRNGYIFGDRLEEGNKREIKKFEWAIVFQSRGSVKLEYMDKNKPRAKVISWASHCQNMTLLKTTPSGKLSIVPVAVRDELRTVPEGKVKTLPMDTVALNNYLTENYQSLYGNYEDRVEEEKGDMIDRNARLNATNTMYDEAIPLNKLVKDIPKFVDDGNVSEKEREKRKIHRQALTRERLNLEKAKKRAATMYEKEKARQFKEKLDTLNPLSGGFTMND